ncbi:MAG: hypothetical protein GX639_08760 [Fibrobacter sp.]|nr:hypothetical protein [Fibrobacter sp.]
MKELNIETIKASWNSMEDLDPDAIPSLVHELGQKQPFLLTYLMATGNDILSEQEREALLFMGVMIWQILNGIYSDITVITGDDLDSYENKNIQMLEYLAGESESEFLDTVEKIMSKYHQPELLRFIISKLDEEPDRGIELSDDNMGMIVIYLKTVIDCFDKIIP